MVETGINAIDDLKSVEKGSLDDTEKKKLADLKEEDIIRVVDELGQKTFEVGGKTVDLKTIVESIVVSKDGSSATLNGKTLGRGGDFWGSDLGAAIQLYVVANNAGDLGDRGFDGKIGAASRRGIQITKAKLGGNGKLGNSQERGKNSREVDNEGWVENISDICNKAIVSGIDKVGKEKGWDDAVKYFEGRGMISSVSGKLTPSNRATFATDKKLVFKYRDPESNKDVDFQVPITEKDVDHNVDMNKLVKDIVEKALKEKGEKLNQSEFEILQAGINSFNERDITDPLIKKWASLVDKQGKKVDFYAKYYNNTKGEITVADYNHKSDAKLNKVASYADLLTNKKFDSAKFNKFLKENYHDIALKAVESNIRDTKDNLVQPSSVDIVASADYAISICTSLIRQIDGYTEDSKALKTVKDEVIAKKEEYQNQKDYLEEKSIKLAAIAKVNRLAGTNNKSFVKNFDEIYKEIQKIVFVEKDRNVKYTYNVNYDTKGRRKFEKAGKKDEYNTMVDGVINKWKNVREGGDEKYTLNVVGR